MRHLLLLTSRLDPCGPACRLRLLARTLPRAERVALAGAPPSQCAYLSLRCQKLGIPEDHIISTVAKHANTSAASIPLALADARAAKKLQPGQLIALTALGTINHTLLTLQLCKDYDLDVRGIVINGMPKYPTRAQRRLPETLEELSGVKVISVIPHSKRVTTRSIAFILDKQSDIENILHL